VEHVRSHYKNYGLLVGLDFSIFVVYYVVLCIMKQIYKSVQLC